MKHQNRTSDAQQRFLRRLRDGTMTLAQIKAETQLSDTRWGRWMRNKFFRAEVWSVLVQSGHHRRVELELAANVAAEMLRTALKKQIVLSADEVLLCKTIIELVSKEREARRRAARRKKRKGTIDEERELCHPDARGERAESLKMLETLE